MTTIVLANLDYINYKGCRTAIAAVCPKYLAEDHFSKFLPLASCYVELLGRINRSDIIKSLLKGTLAHFRQLFGLEYGFNWKDTKKNGGGTEECALVFSSE